MSLRALGVAVVGSFSLLSSAPPALAFWPFGSAESAFIEACEEVLKKRLASPSSYKRIEATEILRSPGNVDDYLEITNPTYAAIREETLAKDENAREAAAARLDYFMAADPERIAVVITYDASNSFGAVLRGKTECSDYVAKGRDWDKSTSFSGPRINGITNMSWLIIQMRR